MPELDRLRRIAIFLVILYHYLGGNPPAVRHNLTLRLAEVLGLGTIGMDLFFILSGFLIGGILLNPRTSPRYYRIFYLRRFFRIIPIYYLWLALLGLARIAEVSWKHFESPLIHRGHRYTY
jgi:peptidoglycan/LPS O-acetylase OafA/YrhL